MKALPIIFGGSGNPFIFKDAVAAYSLRIPSKSTYNGALINVRRSSDNAAQDFYAVTTADGNGNKKLDTSALLTFVGSGTGYVTAWYDQSGNGNHATQTVATSQPVIVNAGALITQNGKPAVYATAVSQWLNIFNGSILGNNVSVLPENYVNSVASLAASVSVSIISNYSPSQFGHGIGNASSGRFYVYYNQGNYSAAANTYPFSTLCVVEAQFSTTQGKSGWVNGTNVYFDPVPDTGMGGQTTGQAVLFDIRSNNGAAGDKYISEILVTKTNVNATSRKAIERDQGVYYGITIS